MGKEVEIVEDREILELFWARAEKALAAVQEKYGRLLHRIALNILEQEQDAQECVNDTYLALWNDIPPQRPDPLCPYVCRTGRNIALKRLRWDRAQKRCSRYDLSIEELSASLAGESLEQQLSARALAQAMDAFLDTQTRENRVLFMRRYWFGDSLQEAARVVGLPANTAAVRLSRLRGRLKVHLEQEGFYEKG